MNIQSKKYSEYGYLALIMLFFLFLAPLTSFSSQEKADETSPKAPISANSDVYIIGSGDILDIITWKEADFSREELFVRIDGKITFPLLGDIQAAGRTTLQLKGDIEKKLTTYVGTPIVTVNIRVPGSQKFYVLGEVVRTGEYNLVKNLTIIQAFALAGGFTEWASKDEIILFRVENGKEEIIRVDYKSILKGQSFKNNILIRANDTIIVP